MRALSLFLSSLVLLLFVKTLQYFNIRVLTDIAKIIFTVTRIEEKVRVAIGY
jgi:hypothetical protein